MKQRLLFLTFVALLATGCSIYHPQAVSIPLVNHKGDAQVDLSVGLSAWILPDVLTLNATGSYGFTDHLAGQAHLNFGFDNTYGHIAAGAYTTMGKYGVVEGYLGFGLGGAWRDRTSYDSDDFDDDDDKSTKDGRSYEYDGHFMLPFAQGNIGLRGLANGHIDLAFGLKAGAFMPDFDYRSYDPDGTLSESRSKLYTTTNFLIEPQFQFRVGSEQVKWNLRVGLAWLSDLPGASVYLVFDWITVSTGLTFAF